MAVAATSCWTSACATASWFFAVPSTFTTTKFGLTGSGVHRVHARRRGVSRLPAMRHEVDPRLRRLRAQHPLRCRAWAAATFATTASVSWLLAFVVVQACISRIRSASSAARMSKHRDAPAGGGGAARAEVDHVGVEVLVLGLELGLVGEGARREPRLARLLAELGRDAARVLPLEVADEDDGVGAPRDVLPSSSSRRPAERFALSELCESCSASQSLPLGRSGRRCTTTAA